MLLVKLVDGKPIKYSVSGLKRDNPNTSFPREMPDDGYPELDVYPVHAKDQPEFNILTEYLVEDYALVNGEWEQSWVITDKADADALTAVERSFKDEIFKRLNAFANTKGYFDIYTAISYANSTNTEFAADAARCLALRDQMWTKAYEILGEVKAGTRSLPQSFVAIESEFPVLTWE